MGGEGRCRPTLLAVKNKFFLFYKDKSASGTSLAILSARPPGKQKDDASDDWAILPAAAEDFPAWAARRLQAGQALDAAADADGDGQDNHSEFVADTDPADPASRFTAAINASPGGTRLAFQSSAARQYRLQFTDDLSAGTWQDAPGSAWVRGCGGPTNLCDCTPVPGRVYRLRVALP